MYNSPASRSAMLDIAELPLAIREKTVDYQVMADECLKNMLRIDYSKDVLNCNFFFQFYQFHRIVLFQRLLLVSLLF